MQFLMYDPNFKVEEATPPTEKLMAEMGKFVGEAQQAGVLVSTGSLEQKGTRLKLSGGKFTVTDGPFIELKELLGGFAVMEVKSLDEAIGWAKRFRSILGEGESEIVRLSGPHDYAPG
jgi:hypothetical protein